MTEIAALADVLDRVRALMRFERDGPRAAPELQSGAAHACVAVMRQLERVADEVLPAASPRTGRALDAARSGDGLLRALLAAFPDRLARRRPDDPRRGVLVGGRGVGTVGAMQQPGQVRFHRIRGALG